jgi:hypothetical protein
MTWLTSMLSDGSNGSVSSKRVIAFLAFVICGAAFMIDLLTQYKVNVKLFDSMMYIVIAGLGFTASEKFASK